MISMVRWRVGLTESAFVEAGPAQRHAPVVHSGRLLALNAVHDSDINTTGRGQSLSVRCELFAGRRDNLRIRHLALVLLVAACSSACGLETIRGRITCSTFQSRAGSCVRGTSPCTSRTRLCSACWLAVEWRHVLVRIRRAGARYAVNGNALADAEVRSP